MKNKSLLVIIILVVLAIFIYYFASNRNTTNSVDTVKIFTENLLKNKPPKFDGDAIKKATEQLSSKAKADIDSIFALAKFAEIKNEPVKDFKIIEAQEKDGKAFVKALWEYSKNPVIKIFNLTYENGKWRIDSIKTRNF